MADSVGVELGHRVEDAQDLTVSRVHLDASREATSQRLACVVVAEGFHDAVPAGALEEMLGQRVEESAP